MGDGGPGLERPHRLPETGAIDYPTHLGLASREFRIRIVLGTDARERR